MSLLGYEGLARVAALSHNNTARLAEGLCGIDGIERMYDGPYFHEVALKIDRPVAPILESLATQNILGGLDLARYRPDLGNALLVCATETKIDEDIDAYVGAMRDIFHSRSQTQPRKSA
jgi:glycine dehydrogenase subunit 1